MFNKHKNGSLTFYGWRIVAVAFVIHLFSTGMIYYSFCIFFKYLMNDFGWSRMQTSLGVTISSLVSAFCAPFIGRLLDTYGTKRLILIGIVILSAGFVLMKYISTLWHFYIVFGGIIALGGLGMGGLASTTLVTNWFIRKRGMALSIATMGVSLGGVVMAPFADYLISIVGWRVTYEIFGTMILVILTPLILLFLKNRPEDMGLTPDGLIYEEEITGSSLFEVQEKVWRLSELIRNRNFWYIILAFTFALTSLTAILLHLVAYLTDLGISNRGASLVLSVAACMGIVGKVIFGYLADRYDKRRVVFLCFLLQMIGTILLFNAGNIYFLIGFLLVFGISMGGSIPLEGAIIGEYFGRKSFGSVAGLMAPFIVGIQSTGFVYIGYIYDRFNSYNWAFASFVVAYFIAGIAIFMVNKKFDR